MTGRQRMTARKLQHYALLTVTQISGIATLQAACNRR
jgi:hypothetical protein